MKIDCTQVLKNYEGVPIYEERRKRDDNGKTVRNENGEPVVEDVELTLRSAINTALMAETPGEKFRTADDKNKARPILKKLWENSRVKFSTKNGGYIIEKVEAIFNPLIIQRVQDIFDNAGEGGEEKEENKNEEKKE